MHIVYVHDAKIVKELEELVLKELGGQCKSTIINKNNPICEIG